MSNTPKGAKHPTKGTKRAVPARTKAARAKPKSAKKALKTNTENSPYKIKSDQIAEITEIDFCGVELSHRMHDFLTYYLTPGSPCFQNAKQAAIKAGYTESTAQSQIYRLLGNPDIQKILKKNEDLARHAFHEEAKELLRAKKRRALFDPIDFYGDKFPRSKDGKTIVRMKNLGDIPPELRVCVDGIDTKGRFPSFILPDRNKEINEILKIIDADLSKSTGNVEYEETLEIMFRRRVTREAERTEQPIKDIEYEIVGGLKGAKDV
jgi:hypothetical protein